MKLFKTATLVFFAVSILAATTPAHSKNRTFSEIYRECGIGGILFNKNTENDRLLAIISNVTWDLGTTAILSNASSDENCTGGSFQAAAFAAEAYPSIERDLAKGEGEYLNTMLSLLGCEERIQADLTNDLRGDMAKVIASTDFDSADQLGKAGTLYDIMDQRIQQSYSSDCTSA